jgi:hypothetical protein
MFDDSLIGVFKLSGERMSRPAVVQGSHLIHKLRHRENVPLNERIASRDQVVVPKTLPLCDIHKNPAFKCIVISLGLGNSDRAFV